MTTRAEIKDVILRQIINAAGAADRNKLEQVNATDGNVAWDELSDFDSYAALDLCMHIEARLGVVVDLADFALAADLDALIDRIFANFDARNRSEHRADADFPDPHLICFRSGAAGQTPLFLIPGADGSAYGFKALVDTLDKSIPIYGLQMRGIDGKVLPRATISEIASDCVASILSLQPTGPYLMLGYSLGGVVGFEAAQQLTNIGAGATHLLMLDSDAPDSTPEPVAPLQSLKGSRYWSRRLGFKQVELLFRKFRRGRREAARQARFAAFLKRGEALPRNEREAYIFSANMKARQRYAPLMREGRLTLFRANTRRKPGDTVALGWEAHCRNHIEVIPVESGHDDILKHPAVLEVATHLQRLMMAIPQPETFLG